MSYIDSIIIENQAELTNAIDTVWVALCAALIFFMEGGFALLESGFVRSKNAMSIIAKVFIDIIFGGIIFYVVGFGIAYGSSNGWFAFDIGISENDLGLGLTVSNQLFWFIQLGFAVAAISIVSGALAERMKLWSYTILVLVFCGIMYPMVANWVWNPSGWLSVIGFNDFAGSAAVHAMGGFSALADQGYFLGEHGFFDKRMMYEESSRMPFVISYPNQILKSRRIDDLILNLDIPSLFLDYAGIKPPKSFQGKSFRKSLESKNNSLARKFTYYRYWEHSPVRPAHLGVRSNKNKLIYFYGEGLNKKNTSKIKSEKAWEYYDLVKDPFELKNEIYNPKYKNEILKLHKELIKQKELAGDKETLIPKINEI